MKKKSDFYKNNARNLVEDPLTTGANLRGAFSNPLPVDVDEEYASEFEIKAMKNEQKKKAYFQKQLQQNYGVEIAEENMIEPE